MYAKVFEDIFKVLFVGGLALGIIISGIIWCISTFVSTQEFSTQKPIQPNRVEIIKDSEGKTDTLYFYKKR
jgi:uncharacterized membrane protein YciS (DUF1049 family)